MKKIAAEGILTCLQDAIDSLNQGQVNYFLLKFSTFFIECLVYSVRIMLLLSYLPFWISLSNI